MIYDILMTILTGLFWFMLTLITLACLAYAIYQWMIWRVANVQWKHRKTKAKKETE